MINLLPSDVKQDYLYARRNTKLRRWIGGLFLSLVGIAVIVIAGQVYIKQSISALNTEIAAAQEQLRIQRLEETQARVDEISGSLKLATQVLSRQVLFSELIRQIGAAMPPNTALTDLKISEVEGGIDLTAIATNYSNATQVQVNLQDPANKIFDKADIISITCGGTITADSRYPCTVTLRAQFAKNNSFLLLAPNQATGGTQ